MRELTDSYCERCGTRYTFGSGPAKGPSLTGARLFAKGLKNFVMTDGTSMDEAMAAARIDVTKDESSRVTEEFHRTFNFCMTCRQYACDKCWNENQGACLSCAPLWDQQPAASQGHQIVQIPVARDDLVGAGEAPAVLHAAPPTANSMGVVAWPEADELPGRTPGRGNGDSPAAERAPRPPILRASQPPAQLPLPAQPPRPVQLPQPAEPPLPAKSSAEPQQQEPPRLLEPVAPPPPTPQAQSMPNEQRQPARVSEEERSAAEQLRTQSEAWRSRDDGWTLWPPGVEPPAGEMTLTPEEIQLVEAQLNRAPLNDDLGAQPTPPAPPAVPPVAATPITSAAADTAAAESTFTPSHTLIEDAARISEPQPGLRTGPATPIPAAWEPETPAPQKAPPSDFDLLGSLREPIELPQPTGSREPRRAAVIGRLFGRRGEAPEAQPEPKPQESIEAAVKSGVQRDSAPASPWPVATPWVQRPIERHDSWSDSDAAAAEHGQPGEANASGAAPTGEPAGAKVPTQALDLGLVAEPVQAAEAEPVQAAEAEPVQAAEAEPVQAAEAEPVAEPAPAPAEQLQQPTFALPVSTDRWAAARPDLPESVVAEQDVAGPVDAPSTSAPQTKPAQPEPVKAEPNGATPWPPIGASWPAPARPEAPWPLPDNDPLPASVVAAAAAEHGDRPESPLLAALWAESAQQVLDRGTVRVCMRCALPVSTQARFCRRCGAQQG